MSTTPRRLGQYELLHYLGRGNVGEVWKARDLAQHRDVAVKIFHSDLQRSEQQFLTRLTSEGRALVSLRHSNIVPVHDIKVTRPAQSQETTAYLVMDYIEGQTLADYLRATSHKGIFPALPDIIYLFTSLGVAIDHAHQQGIVHGNIKPANILLNKQETTQFRAGEPLLTDFDLTRLVGLTGDSSTPYYISPEQAQGNSASNRSDVYALGVILYELCTGIVPFRDESSVAVMMQHIRALPTPPNLINPNIPQALSEVILRAMSKDPITRFSMASLLAAAIADACSLQSTLYIGEQLSTPREEIVPMNMNVPTTSFLGVAQPPTGHTSGQLPGTTSLPSLRSLPSSAKTATLPTGQSGAMEKTVQQSPSAAPTSRPLTSGPLTSSPPGSSATTRIAVPLQSGGLSPTGAMSAITRPQQSSPSPGGEKAAYETPTRPTPAAQPMATTPAAMVPYASPQARQPAFPAQSSAPPFPQPLSTRARQLYARAPGYVITASLLLIILVLGCAIGISILLNKGSGTASAVPGRVFFQDNSQGLGRNSWLRIDLYNVGNPPDGKEYFAWLEDSSGNARPLGAFPNPQNGNTSLHYQGDNKNTNLLSIIQGVFITVEDAGTQPQQPGTQKVYTGTFETDMLQHIKDILYSTPGLPQGQSVVVELLETIRSINDKAASINDSLNQDNPLVIRQATRIIEMIDGSEQAGKSGDRPANVAPQLTVDRGLLSAPGKTGYIDLLDQQIDAFKQVAGDNAMQLQHLQGVKNAITDLRQWIQNLHDKDVQLLKAADLHDPAITGVALQIKQAAADSYTGRTIPPNTSPQPTIDSAGAVQAYTEAQYLASLDLINA